MQIPSEGTIEEDEGVFLVMLNADGLCTDFRERWNSRSHPAIKRRATTTVARRCRA